MPKPTPKPTSKPDPNRAKIVRRYNALLAKARDTAASDNERKQARAGIGALIAEHPDLPAWAADAAASAPDAPRTPPEVDRFVRHVQRGVQAGAEVVAGDVERAMRAAAADARKIAEKRARQAASNLVHRFFDAIDPGHDD